MVVISRNSRRLLIGFAAAIFLFGNLGGLGGSIRRALQPAVPFDEFWTGTEEEVESSSLTPQITESVAPPKDTWLIGDDLPHSNTIPKLVHKVFLQKGAGFPDLSEMSENLKAAHKTWHDKNPEYLVQYFDLRLCREYLEKNFHPVFLRAFDCIQAFAGKNNLFRMAVVYREGGWYSDWKQVCLKDDLLSILTEDVKEGAMVFRDNCWLDGPCWEDGGPCKELGGPVQNAFFGATPQHPLIAQQLGLILNHVQSFYHPSPYWTTGVGVFGTALQESKDNHYVTDNVVGGHYNSSNYFYYNDEDIILHKCWKCGTGQDWKNGNNYKKLHREGHYYCEDRKSLFETTDAEKIG